MGKTLTYYEIARKFEQIFKDLHRNLEDLNEKEKLSVLQSVIDAVAKTGKPRYCLCFVECLGSGAYNKIVESLDYTNIRNTVAKIKNINHEDLKYFSTFCNLSSELEKHDNLIFNVFVANYNINEVNSSAFGYALQFLNQYAEKNGVINSANLVEFYTKISQSYQYDYLLLNSPELFKLANYMNEEDIENVQKLIPANKMYEFVAFVDKKVNQELAIEALIQNKNLWNITFLCEEKKLSSHEVLNKFIDHAASDETFWQEFANKETHHFRTILEPVDQFRLDESYLSSADIDNMIEYSTYIISELNEQQISLIKDRVYSMSPEDYYVSTIAETYADLAKIETFKNIKELEENFINILDNFDCDSYEESPANLVDAVDKMMQIEGINKDKLALLISNIQTEEDIDDLLGSKEEFLKKHLTELNSSTIEALEDDIFSNFTDDVVTFAYDYACDKDKASLSTIKEQKYLLECLKVAKEYNLDEYEIYDNLWPFLDFKDCLKEYIQNALAGYADLGILAKAAQQEYADVQFFGKIVVASHDPDANNEFLEIEGCDRDAHLEQIAAYGDPDMQVKHGIKKDELSDIRKIIANIPSIGK